MKNNRITERSREKMKVSNEERLKVIKGTPYFISDDVLLKDFKWLVEQAEKLESITDTWIRVEENYEDVRVFYSEVQDILSERE